MTPAISALAGGVTAPFCAPAARRRRDPRQNSSQVRSRSLYGGDVERLATISRGDSNRRIAALEREIRDKRPGYRQRHGCAGTYSAWALPIYAYLMDLWVKHGRVFPPRDTIAAAIGCCVTTVDRVKAQLQAGGWLKWVHRCVSTGRQGERGPQVEQISNWYVPLLPASAAQLLASWRAAHLKRRGMTDAGEEVRVAAAAGVVDDQAAQFEAQRAEEIEADRRRRQTEAAERIRNAFGPGGGRQQREVT